MRFDRGKFDTYHLTCMFAGRYPGTTCLDEDYQELAQVHPSRPMSIGERNWRFRQGWEPPERVERRRKRQAEEKARAAGPAATAAARMVLAGLMSSSISWADITASVRRTACTDLGAELVTAAHVHRQPRTAASAARLRP